MMRTGTSSDRLFSVALSGSVRWLCIEKRAVWLYLTALLVSAVSAADKPFVEEPVPLSNSGFENGIEGWTTLRTGVVVQSENTVRLNPGSSLKRNVTISRGLIEQQGRRCIVRARAKVQGDVSLKLRVRCGGAYRDAILRKSGERQDIFAVIDTPNYLPGADAAAVEIGLSVAGDGYAIVDKVRVTTLAPYGMMLRLTVFEPSAVKCQTTIRIIRHHRDTNHPDSIRHNYFSTIVPAGPGLSPGKPGPWIDLRRYLFGHKHATVTVILTDKNTGQPLSDARARVELAVPREADSSKAKAKPDPLVKLDDEFDDISLDDEPEKKPEPHNLLTVEAHADRGVVSLLLPENEVRPEDFIKRVRTVQMDTAERLAWLDSVYPEDGPLPQRIPVAANISALDKLLNDADLKQEVKVLRRIGISAVSRSFGTALQSSIDQIRSASLGDKPFNDRVYWRLGEDEIISPYDGDRLRKRVAAHYQNLADKLKKAGDTHNVGLVELLDEPPDFAPTEQDVPAFRSFLQELGVKPSEVGAADWKAIRPWGLPEPGSEATGIVAPDLGAAVAGEGEELSLEEPDVEVVVPVSADVSAPIENRRLRYFTRLFIARRTSDIFGTATKAVEKNLPGVHTSVNFRAGIRRVLTSETADWFEFGRRRAVTMMWNEDWLNTYGWRNNGIQLVSYYTELMRTAARPHDLPHGCFVIVMGHALEKAYSALAHGARRVSFWRYGPAYANYLPYSWSHSRGAVHDIATFSRDVAAIEDVLVESRRHEAKVAVLYAKADPLWGYSQAENRLVSFALLHDQVPWEVITEAEIEQDDILKSFDMVYITDVSIRRQTQKHLVEWVKQGGAAWLSGGAATRDEFHEPCTVLHDVLGVQADSVSGSYREGTAGRGRFRVMATRPGEQYEVPVRARFNRNRGKGRIQTGWPDDIREQITSFVSTDVATRPVSLDVPCVEAILYRHAETDLLFLINYTGKSEPVDIAVTIRARPDIIGISSLRHGNIKHSRKGNDVTFSIRLDRADTVLLAHGNGDQSQ